MEKFIFNINREGEGLWDLLYGDDLVITGESEEEAVRKFGVWRREIETRGLKVSINKDQVDGDE